MIPLLEFTSFTEPILLCAPFPALIEKNLERSKSKRWWDIGHCVDARRLVQPIWMAYIHTPLKSRHTRHDVGHQPLSPSQIVLRCFQWNTDLSLCSSAHSSSLRERSFPSGTFGFMVALNAIARRGAENAEFPR